jgi:anti-anti-sigma factor
MTAASRPRTDGPHWLSRRPATRRLYDTVQRHLVGLPTIRLPLTPLGATDTDAALESIGMGGCRLSVSRRMCEAVVVVTVDGDVTAEGSRELDHKLQRILAAGNLSRLVIDLSRVGFLSDAGVRTLIRAHNTGRLLRIPLRVVTGDGAAGAVLDMCDFRSRIPTSPDVDTACTEIFKPGG